MIVRRVGEHRFDLDLAGDRLLKLGFGLRQFAVLGRRAAPTATLSFGAGLPLGPIRA